jgi:hypothetical protein
MWLLGGAAMTGTTPGSEYKAALALLWHWAQLLVVEGALA